MKAMFMIMMTAIASIPLTFFGWLALIVKWGPFPGDIIWPDRVMGSICLWTCGVAVALTIIYFGIRHVDRWSR